jgi:lipopolysaccharide transport system ATP-binding protein
MYVRLAFAVAAHLEPEILLVDEVLAVGDAAFQKKCLGKMNDVAKEGRTVLFVSHNMAAVNRLCSRGIWLQNGQVHGVGITTEIVGSYLAEGTNSAAQVFFERRPNVAVQYRSVCVTDSKGDVSQYILDDQGFTIEMEIEAYETISDIYFGMILQNLEGINVLFADSRDVEHSLPSTLQSGRHRICLHFPAVFAPGRYSIILGIATKHPIGQLDYIEGACSFEIVKNSNMQRTALRPGIINLNLPWEMEE